MMETNLLESLFLLGLTLILIVPFIAGGWKMFVKAGRPGWAFIIPVYNLYILLKIVNRPGWWLILFFIPIANIVFPIIVGIDLAKAFNKNIVFGILLLWLLAPLGYLIVGFDSSKYVGQTAPQGNQPPQAPPQGGQVPPQNNQMPPQQGTQAPNQTGQQNPAQQGQQMPNQPQQGGQQPPSQPSNSTQKPPNS